MEGQINLFEYLEGIREEKIVPHISEKILAVGDLIGRVVLGECRIARVTEIEGFPDYPFYRTDSGGCYTIEEGFVEIDELKRKAEKQRKQYNTVVPAGLQERLTVIYKPRQCDGKVLWAQIGILDNMLFWKEDMTYQFLEPYDSEKKLRKAYEKHKEKILDKRYGEFEIVDQEHEMRRLYWSKHGFYADAEYVLHNN